MSIDVFEVVYKLIGPVDPVGETHTDDKRFENLKEFCKVTEQMLQVIHNVSYDYRNNHQFSMKRASTYCTKFLDDANIKE
jgi:hypothetical protein